jgi:DNA mismatch repair protein MutS2
MGAKADVISVSDDKTLVLQAGIMRVSVKEDEVLLLEDQNQTNRITGIEKSTAKLNTASVGNEIDIRGMTADEAIPVMERFIDSAFMGKLGTVTVIHGKGTGAPEERCIEKPQK